MSQSKVKFSLGRMSLEVVELTDAEQAAVEAARLAALENMPPGDDDADQEGDNVAVRLALLEDAFVELLMLQMEGGV